MAEALKGGRDHGHDRHDERLIAGLLGRDAADPERPLALARVASCAECAAVLADLVALSRATTELRPAPRTRDFRLTPADAARLTAAAPGEPGGANARLTREMTVPSTDHATHDALLIASLLDRLPLEDDRGRAEALVAVCHDCAALHRDLVALSAATRAIPTPPRPRDFTLAPGDVARLRPSAWRRLVALIGSSRDIFSRPLAIGLTTLGLAGLLVATIPGAFFGQGTSAPVLQALGQSTGGAGGDSTMLEGAGVPVPTAARAADQLAPSAAPSAAAPALAPPNPQALPIEPTSDTSAAGPVASSGAGAIAPEAAAPEGTPAVPKLGADLPVVVAGRDVEQGGGPDLVVVAGLLLIAGLGLFAIRRVARRLRAD